MIKVAKFGGSSVASSEQFQKVRKIIEADPSRKFIVVSACGKQSKDDHKITDLLYLTHAHLKYGVSYESVFSLVEEKYCRIREELGLKTDLASQFRQIRQTMVRDMSQDYLVSRGEYLTGLMMAEYLGFRFVDAADVIAFRYDGSIDMEKTAAYLERFHGESVVIPGFYGAMPNGVIKVMTRGGSDITGAVIANIIDADVYENWTDVSGFYVCDPRIVEHPLQIPRITYSELRSLSYMGANVLHDDAVFPVKVKNIPINIKNTNDPESPGTMILEDCSSYDEKDPPHVITGITGRKNYTVLTVVKSHSSAETGFLRKLLAVFDEYRVPVESVPATVDTVSIIASSEKLDNCIYEIIGRIKENLQVDDIRVEDHVALIAIIGRGMKEQPGISGRLLSEFGNNQINIKVISQTADELSIQVGVMNRDFETAIRCIYEKFIVEERSHL